MGMTLRRIAFLLVLALAVAIPSTALARSSSNKLVGEVGPGFTIELKQGSKDVKTLKAGTYTILVEDKAAIHDFHLMGAGLNKKTGVSFIGDQTWKITLKAGKVTYQCDPHAAMGMKGSFRVTP